MLKRWLVLLMLVLQAFFTLTASAEITVPPKPADGSAIYIQDYAHLLSPKAKEALNAIGSELDKKTTAQVALVTVRTLDNQPIEEYALTLLRNWGIGNKEKNNGILILVASGDRQSRIEVGYGLEGAIPDGLAGRVQDQRMIPYFKNDRYEDGIINGYITVANLVANEYEVQLSGLQKANVKQPVESQGWTFADLALVGAIILLLIIDNIFFGGFITQILILSLFRGGGRGGGGGGFGGGSFGGGSGGGGGASRRW